MLDSTPFASCIHKQSEIKQLFFGCTTPDAVYKKIIELGRQLPYYPPEQKIEQKIVSGCQSVMYLHSFLEGKTMRFCAHCDALISAGLAVLLMKIYDGESPEAVLKCPPYCIEELALPNLLSPSRTQGLSSFFLRMKQDTLGFLLQ